MPDPNTLPTLPVINVPPGLPHQGDAPPFGYAPQAPMSGQQPLGDTSWAHLASPTSSPFAPTSLSSIFGIRPQTASVPPAPFQMTPMGEGTGAPYSPPVGAPPFSGGGTGSQWFQNALARSRNFPAAVTAGLQKAYGIGGGGGGAGGATPAAPTNLRLFHSQQVLDPILGVGWSEQFTAAHNGMDPLSFYAQAFPQLAYEPEKLQFAARDAAVNDARYLPRELENWAQLHGNVPPPPEQWDTWWRINQNGGPDYGAGMGINPFGNH